MIKLQHSSSANRNRNIRRGNNTRNLILNSDRRSHNSGFFGEPYYMGIGLFFLYLGEGHGLEDGHWAIFGHLLLFYCLEDLGG